ncbi:hypothetical protein AtEden1_Chr4g0281161 [Arabidopsis thaliana]
MEREGASTICPLELVSPLFLSCDGFELSGVLFPHVIDKHHRMCDERQRSGLKRQMLEARIACVERNVRALESDPFQWEWRNFDSVAKIPTMLRMYLRS